MLEKIRSNIKLSKQGKISLEKIFQQIWELEFKVSKEELQKVNQEAFNLAAERKKEDLFSYALAQVTFGIFYFYTSDYKRALEHYLDALDNFRLIKNEPGIGLSYMNMGATYRSLGDLDLAIKYSREGVELLTKNNAYPKFLCYAHYGLAEIYLGLQAYDLCLENYEKALDIAYQINDSTGIIRSLNGLGNANLKVKDFQKSMDYLKESLNKVNKDDLVIKSRILNDLGNYHFETNNLLNAKKYYEESILIRQNLNLVDAQLSSQIGLAKTLIGQNQLQEAKLILTEGLKKATGLKVKVKLFEFHELLSKVYELLLDFQASLEHFKAFHQTKNQVIDENSRNRIEKIKTMHELVLKRKESESNYYQQTTKQLEKQKELIEQKVIERTLELKKSNEELQVINEELRQAQEEIAAQKDYVQSQNIELSHINHQVSLSIRSAKTIQDAILPQEQLLNNTFQDYFILNRPKDVVSGDFYWLHKVENRTIIVVGDCTGHGVPGAFMTLIAANLLDKIIRVKHIYDPASILNILHQEVLSSLKQSETKDNNGMDVAIIAIDELEEQRAVTYAGAKSGILIWKDEQLVRIKGTRKSIGGIQNESKTFENRVFSLQSGDLVYLGSDGLQDQNDSDRNKFSITRINSLIEEIHPLPFDEQLQKFETTLDKFMEGTTQRDDILWFGLKV